MESTCGKDLTMYGLIGYYFGEQVQYSNRIPTIEEARKKAWGAFKADPSITSIYIFRWYKDSIGSVIEYYKRRDSFEDKRWVIAYSTVKGGIAKKKIDPRSGGDFVPRHSYRFDAWS